MSNIPITSRVTVSLLGVFLQTRSLQVDGGSPSLWTSQQGWSDMQPLLKVHGSHFLSLAANLAFPLFPLSSWISLPVKRFLSEACQQQKILLRSEFSIASVTPVTQDHLYSINAVPRKIYELPLHWQRATLNCRIFTFEPKTLTSCSSYSSVFLFMMSMHGPSSRSNAIVSRTAHIYNNKDAEVQEK